MKVFSVEGGNLFPLKSTLLHSKFPLWYTVICWEYVLLGGGGGSFNTRGRGLLAGK